MIKRLAAGRQPIAVGLVSAGGLKNRFEGKINRRSFQFQRRFNYNY